MTRKGTEGGKPISYHDVASSGEAEVIGRPCLEEKPDPKGDMEGSTEERLSLVGLNADEISERVVELGLPRYRGRQIAEWIYGRRAARFAEMTSLPDDVRNRLEEIATIRPITLLDRQESSDGTVKFLFRTEDGYNVESVLIPSEARDDDGDPRRRTICVSSQVGCPLDCKFCATASMKLKRNLTAGEITAQHLEVERALGDRISNIVFMGMGEPMLNIEAVIAAIRILSDERFDLVPARRITVSTSGVIPGIERLASEGLGVKLAVSLHVTTDGDRDRLMPINRKYKLSDLLQATDAYYRTTRRPITWEYILFDGINDSEQDVRRLARITRRVPSKVNVIPFHPIDFTNPTGIAAELRAPSAAQFDRFIASLRSEGVPVMVRSSSGLDIDAACGQLAIRHEQGSL